MMSKSRSDNAVLNINGVDYGCIISGISKSEQANVLQKGDLNKKRRTLSNTILHNFFI